MFDNNWKTWLVLVIAFLGASFELLKHLPTTQNITWEKENLHYGMDGKPYSVRELPKKLRAPVRPAVHIAGDQKALQEALKTYTAANTTAATEAEHKVAPAKAADAKKKKKKDDDEYEEVFDPATGKLVKRKKKKKEEAKKEDEKPKTAVVASGPVTPDDAAPENSDAAAIAAAIAESAATGEIPLPIKQSNNDPFMSLQEWERLLLQRPDLSETKVFIQDFKNHTVSSDIYYKIAKMMIADSRPEMKSLGVLVAGSNVSVLSFQILADVASSSSGDPKTNAAKYIDAYSNSIGNLQILLGVMRGTDNVASAQSLHEFDQAATKFLSASATSTGGTVHTSNATQFQPFVAVLTQLSHSSDTGVASQAAHSLSNLESLLGGSGNTNVAATP